MCLDYIKKLFFILLCAISFNASCLDSIIEGKHYKILDPKYNAKPDIARFRANDKNKVQVMFFFNYGCHVCSMLNIPFDNWAKDKKISIYHIPVTSRGLENLTKAYYTAFELDPSGKIDDAIFKGINEKRINYSRESLLADLFLEYGIPKEKFTKTFNSFAVDRQVKKSIEIVGAYNITATPIIVINGKNKIYLTNLVFTKSIPTLLKTMDFILSKEL